MERKEVYLRCRAPFGTWRPFSSGMISSCSAVMPPSAAKGLILGLTGEAGGWDAVEGGEVAVGRVREGTLNWTLQQLMVHASDNGFIKKRSGDHGQKSWVRPAWRPFLAGVDFVIGLRAAAPFVARLATALESAPVPWAGDTCFLWEELTLAEVPPPTFWAVPVPGGEGVAFPLDVRVDRTDQSASVRRLFRFSHEPAFLP